MKIIIKMFLNCVNVKPVLFVLLRWIISQELIPIETLFIQMKLNCRYDVQISIFSKGNQENFSEMEIFCNKMIKIIS